MDFNLNEIIAQRPNKTIYRDGQRVIKVMNAEYPASDVLNEALNMSIVYETGFRVPILYEVLKIDGCWAIVMEYIKGRTLAEQMRETLATADICLERLVDTQWRMHSFTTERLRHLTDKMLAKIDQSGLDAATRYELHARLAGLARHKKLCHGDFTPGNVIITPQNEACVIDWAHATQGNASADAARTYLRFALAGDMASAERYLDLFCQKSGTAKPYVQQWLAIVAASQLVKNNPAERAFLLKWVNVVEG